MNKFLKLSTWRMIINSRVSAYKNSKTDWCKERRKICSDCNQNSIWYNPKNWKEELLRIFYLNKEYCKICFCPINRKTLVRESECSMPEIGEPSKWKRVELGTKFQKTYDNNR